MTRRLITTTVPSLVALGLGVCAPAYGADAPNPWIACTAMSPVEVGELDARLRTRIAASSDAALNVYVLCEGARVRILVSSSGAVESRELDVPASDRIDALLAVADALLENHERTALPVPAPIAEPPAPSPPALAPAPSPFPPPLTPDDGSFAAVLSPSVGFVYEAWWNHPGAMGPRATLTYRGWESIEVGLSVGGRFSVGLPLDFAVRAFDVGLGLDGHIGDAHALTLGAGLVASVVWVDPPEATLAAQSTTMAGVVVRARYTFRDAPWGLTLGPELRVYTQPLIVERTENDVFEIPIATMILSIEAQVDVWSSD
jgi:hypothetical protein